MCVFHAAPKHALWCAEHPWSTSVRCRQYNVPLSLRRSSTLADVCCLHRGTQRILAGTDGVLRVHAGAVRVLASHLSLCHSGRLSLRHNGRLKKATEEQVSTARRQPLSTEHLLSTSACQYARILCAEGKCNARSLSFIFNVITPRMLSIWIFLCFGP